ncbi:MAG: Uma2 family endonuclease [Cyclobacteriaceae bacterium]
MDKFELNVAAFGRLSDEEFFRFCQDNEDVRIERDATGKIIIMAPTGSLSGNRNSSLLIEIGSWNRQTKKGYVFDSSAGFTLSNGAVRSPDVSFVLKDKWEGLTPEEQEGFAPVCPDFVLELRSKNDRLEDLKTKMEEYITNGAAFGWLIDPYERNAYVYDAQDLTASPSATHADFSQPLTSQYFMQDCSVVLNDIL